MKVLNSSKLFREHYATRAVNVFGIATALGAGSALSSGVVGTSAAVASTAAVNASAWSAFASWPLVGGLCAGKAAAVGAAAATAAATSAAVLVPAGLILGAGVACAFYFGRGRKTIQKGSRIDDLADAFAHVAFLPMLSRAVAFCKAHPSNTESVRNYFLKKMAEWGYAESYARAGFDEAMRHSAAEIDGQYKWAMRRLKAGTTEGIGATPAELPLDAVRGFADEFKKDFESCKG